jgi:hypothetical protein
MDKPKRKYTRKPKMNLSKEISVGDIQKAINVGTIKDIEDFFAYCSSAEDLTFEQMVSIGEDPVVKSKCNLLLNKSKTYYKALNYDLASVEVADYIDNSLLRKLDWDNFDRYIFYSKPFGKSVVQLKWEKDGKGGADLVDFIHLDPRYFTINQDLAYGDIGDLMIGSYNLTRDYPLNFICIKNDVNFLYQGGQSDFRQIRDIVAFKRLIMRIKSNYFQKAVIPAIVGIYESEKTGTELQEEADIFSAIFNNIQNGSGVALANFKSVIPLQQNGQVNFERTEELLNKTISVRILGSDLTDSQSKGTYGQASIGAEYIEGNVKELGSSMQRFRNIVLQYAVWAKFGISEKAPYYIYDFNEPYPKEVFESQSKLIGYTSWYEFNKVYPMPKSMKPPKDDILIFNEYKKALEEEQQSQNENDNNNNNNEENPENNNQE